jgi:hypothetical protein
MRGNLRAVARATCLAVLLVLGFQQTANAQALLIILFGG